MRERDRSRGTSGSGIGGIAANRWWKKWDLDEGMIFLDDRLWEVVFNCGTVGATESMMM